MFYLNLVKCDLHKWHQPTNSSKLNKWLREASQNKFFSPYFSHTQFVVCDCLVRSIIFFCVMQTSMLSLLFDLECWCGAAQSDVWARAEIFLLFLCVFSYSMDRAFVSFRKQLITLQEFKSSRHVHIWFNGAKSHVGYGCTWLTDHLPFFGLLCRSNDLLGWIAICNRGLMILNESQKHFSFKLSLSSAHRWWSFSFQFFKRIVMRFSPINCRLFDKIWIFIPRVNITADRLHH